MTEAGRVGRRSLLARNRIGPCCGERLDGATEVAGRASRQQPLPRKCAIGDAFFDQFRIGFTVPLSTYVMFLEIGHGFWKVHLAVQDCAI
jgi:hypothetical protein